MRAPGNIFARTLRTDVKRLLHPIPPCDEIRQLCHILLWPRRSKRGEGKALPFPALLHHGDARPVQSSTTPSGPCPGGGEAPAEGVMGDKKSSSGRFPRRTPGPWPGREAGAGRRLWASARSLRLSVESGRGDGPCQIRPRPTSPHSPGPQNPPDAAHSPLARTLPAPSPRRSCSSRRSPSWWSPWRRWPSTPHIAGPCRRWSG